MKKILAILTSDVIYGKERSNIEVYNLIKDKVDCDLRILVSKSASAPLTAGLGGLNTETITRVNRGAKKFRTLTFVWTYIKGNISMFCELKKYHPDLLMVNTAHTFYDYYLALLSFKGKILFRAGDDPGAYHELSLYAYNNFVWKHYILKRLTRVVCISHFVMNCFAKEGRDMKDDVIIYNYPPARRQPQNDERGKYLLNDGNRFTYGYIGQITEQKGVHLFIQCAIKILQHYPDALFYIAGSLNYIPTYSQSLKEMIPIECKDSIIFLDEIEDIALFFSHIDVHCMCSYKGEALGNVIVEAKKNMKPSIVFPVGGPPELIANGIDGFICDNPDVSSLLCKMKIYLTEEGLAERQGKAALESMQRLKICRKFYEENWLAVMNEVL